jgi:phytoene dehydrogenase-like protein
MAPPGKTVIRAHFPTRYDYWKDLRAQGDAYAAEKQCIAESVIKCLDRRFPGIKQQVEVVDVTTPATVEGFVGAIAGSRPGRCPTRA